MDASTLAVIASIIVAVVAIIPGVAALVNQGKNDANKAKLDMNAAAMSMIEPLQKEVTRLNARIVELEQALIDKTKEIGGLTQALITKDNELLTMRYQVDKMQLKLDQVVSTKKRTKVQIQEQDDSDAALQEELKANEEKLKEAQSHTEKLVAEIQEKSISNGHTTPIEGE